MIRPPAWACLTVGILFAAISSPAAGAQQAAATGSSDGLLPPALSPPPTSSPPSPNAPGRPLIVLTELAAPADDQVAERLAAAISRSLELMMRLSGKLEVERADFLTPNFSFDHAREYYRMVHADGAVYGTVGAGKDGLYAVELSIWSQASPAARPSVVRRSFSNLLDLFEFAERISLTVASRIVGRSLSDGMLVVQDAASLGDFAVYADGQLLGRNRTSFRLLAGKREVVVAKAGGSRGDVPVQVFHVDIEKDGTTTVQVRVAAAVHVPVVSYRPAEPGRPAELSIDRRLYPLDGYTEYRTALAALQEVPQLSTQMRATISSAETELARYNRRVIASLGLLALSGGGVAALAVTGTAQNRSLGGYPIAMAGVVVGLGIVALVPDFAAALSLKRADADIRTVVSGCERLRQDRTGPPTPLPP